MDEIVQGVVIGGAGGAIAGLTIWLVDFIREKVGIRRDSEKVYRWLKEATTDQAGSQFRSTRAIASWNDLTQERVREICSLDKRIFLSTGERDDMWGLHAHVPRTPP